MKVATGDTDDDGGIEVIAGAGPGGGPAVRTFEGLTGTQVGGTLFVFNPAFRGGIVVSGRALELPGEGSPLIVDGTPAPGSDSGPALSAEQLSPIIAAALSRLEAAGVSAAALSELSSLQFVVSDLGGRLLGLSRPGVISIDDDAAGFGWFVDYSPLLDEEFGADGSSLDGLAAGRVDLLTAVLHELGHALGLNHGVDDLMAGTLAPGVRRAELDELFASEGLEPVLG